uniref:Putative ankyrin repeat protein n=1 Tax=Noccaea caerulescens TaxID=107243 RepID=A0A1J3IBL2_NOCCA
MAPDASAALAEREKVQQFLNAACTGNLDFLKKVAEQLDEGKDLRKTVESIKDANKRGALHFAAREGQTDVCRYLLEDLKLDADTKDEAGDTPLVHAARQGQIETAKYLLAHRADANIASELGATALHHAAGTGEIELLKELLSRGVPVDSQSESGTPLVWAAGHDQKDAVEVLLQHNANPNAETEDGVTPLLSAVAAGSLACLELLVKAGAKANVFAGGATPLHIAADIGSLELINCLLEAGADPNQKDEEGNRPLEVAAARENRKVIEILFPLTTKPESVSDWSVDGILAHMESNKEREQEANSNKAKLGETGIKRDLPQVSEEAKAKAAEAKARGQDAFHRKDFQMAIDAYTQAIDFDPTDHTFFSNRSLCWLRLGQAEHALSDAKACRELKPDWPKGCFREGAALRLLQRFDEAANAFYEGVLLSPESKELVDAFREAVDAGRKFHGKDKIDAKS